MLFLVSCNERIPSDNTARIMAMGDSLLAWQAESGEAIPNFLEQELGEEVINRAVTGSYMIKTLPFGDGIGLVISRQYSASDWDWVILSGGGNDLRFGCGCKRCDAKLDSLISPNGTSAMIPELVKSIRADGARVIFVGYVPNPGLPSPIDRCQDEGTVLERRLTRMAEADPGIYFLSFANLVPYGDSSFHADDRIHPSNKTSRIIAKEIASIIRQ